MAQQTEKFYIQTYGCQMNVADSDRMTALLERAGGEAVATPDEADVVLLNTCSALEMPKRGTPSWMTPDPHMTTDLVDLLPDSVPPAHGKLKAFVPVILGCDF